MKVTIPQKLILRLVILLFGLNTLNAQNLSMKITVGSTNFTATLNDNPTVVEFIKLLPMTLNMSELGGIEKFYFLSQPLPGAATNPGTINAGDLMIYSSNCLVVFYSTHNTSYNYIPLGKINDITGLTVALGSGNLQVSFQLLEVATDITHFDKPNAFQVWPNPAENYIEVSGNVENISLHSINGNVILSSRENAIDVSDVPSGIYFLQIETQSSRIYRRKLIVN